MTLAIKTASIVPRIQMEYFFGNSFKQETSGQRIPAPVLQTILSMWSRASHTWSNEVSIFITTDSCRLAKVTHGNKDDGREKETLHPTSLTRQVDWPSFLPEQFASRDQSERQILSAARYDLVVRGCWPDNWRRRSSGRNVTGRQMSTRNIHSAMSDRAMTLAHCDNRWWTQLAHWPVENDEWKLSECLKKDNHPTRKTRIVKMATGQWADSLGYVGVRPQGRPVDLWWRRCYFWFVQQSDCDRENESVFLSPASDGWYFDRIYQSSGSGRDNLLPWITWLSQPKD